MEETSGQQPTPDRSAKAVVADTQQKRCVAFEEIVIDKGSGRRRAGCASRC